MFLDIILKWLCIGIVSHENLLYVSRRNVKYSKVKLSQQILEGPSKSINILRQAADITCVLCTQYICKS